jgi:nucleoside-diphosphate-sugar epimerase
MKIVLLGSNGFIGKNLVSLLSNKFEIIPVNRQTLDLLDPLSVRNFLIEKKVHTVINAAAIMTDSNLLDDTRNNLGIFLNFYHNHNLFSKFINLASGAEYDRTLDINLIKETEIFNRLPKDSYGFGQNIKSRLSWDRENFFNIRIFNCFGIGEYSTRLFTRFVNQGHIDISNDRYFDYFSLEDLHLLVDHCITNDWSIKDVNAVYEKKYKISEVIEMFCNINSFEPKFTILNEIKNNYTGSAENLLKLEIPLTGLEKGLAVYKKKD